MTQDGFGNMRVVLLTKLEGGIQRGVDQAILRILKEKDMDLVGVVVERTIHGPFIPFVRNKVRRYIRIYGLWGFWRILTKALEISSKFWQSKLGQIVDRTNRAQEEKNKRYRSFTELRKDIDFPLFFTKNIHSDESLSLIQQLQPDLIVVYGHRILKRPIFEIPREGAINLHHGKVPYYRGGPPCFWELYHQEKTVGVTVHYIDAGLDTGDIILQKEIPIDTCDTLESLRDKIYPLGVEMLVQAINLIKEGKVRAVPQDRSKGKTYSAPTIKQEAHLRKILKERQQLKGIS
ncbi:methionyl-tRNA formyltransferase [Candidatus Hakubella thermalkaliphila]|uniref:Methionyl-tRNA formyltransferase n=2 Tax=Candidatus Hakubella thermalkaliphila TaxID=2754717 RepID=A0A6V8NP19_9ACTN|nr:methionyl-tRNA formyltransferase [Candidatus Hakubella thermalkaliphila]GFP21104.1 methionyl-tRNA formyltransferase [Candidatus Hakubella thermalkaliphila]GFP31152.1 methionyl-tRNA formyltransferase [Candidatus Hakubella thermalkaliphila]GFP38705.1 methionyl-tRNA formyltransferase [Candidatus Hakubella thermalkaliphila]GFP41204.1 methionyl-tRNA formyltransferase [Candidatus Hakubella thermalkaliphila]